MDQINLASEKEDLLPSYFFNKYWFGQFLQWESRNEDLLGNKVSCRVRKASHLGFKNELGCKIRSNAF